MRLPQRIETTKPSPAIAWALLPLTLLIVPLIAMAFTSAVDWTVVDFGVGAFLLLILGLGSVLIARARGRWSWWMLTGISMMVAAVLIWIELAVGVL